MSKQTRTKSPQEYPEWINCGNETNAYLAYLAMFRYAFGRMTYMPGTVISIIKANAARLTLRTLEQLDRELDEAAQEYERRYANHPDTKGLITGGNYGMECDRRNLLSFHEWVKEQIIIKTKAKM